jgi:hypothetical protein
MWSKPAKDGGAPQLLQKRALWLFGLWHCEQIIFYVSLEDHQVRQVSY